MNWKNDPDITSWFIKAFLDEKMAEKTLDLEDAEDLAEGICFHSQQLAEKILKAFCIVKNVPFPRTHSIEKLIQLCGEIDNDFLNLDIGRLSDYAVDIRYPGDYFLETLSDATIAFKQALTIKNEVWDKLEITEQDVSTWRKNLQRG